MSTSHEIIKANGVSMDYQTPTGVKHVLDNINFSLHEGEFASIVGPSGVGKTTLLRLLTGLMQPTKGSIEFKGTPITAPPAGLSVVLQDYTRSLMPWLTVEKNISLPLKKLGMSKDEMQQVIDEVLNEVGLKGNQKNYPWQLSGGMQQRVAIARAIAVRPQLLIMDEPFASVDAQTRFDLEDLVLKVRDDFKITTAMVTHDIDEAVYLSDKVIVLYGSPAGVKDIIDVKLPVPRNQVDTRGHETFADLRTKIYEEVRGIQ
ncbi:MAG: Bicarbonate transport ATP-binding protein CmpD [Actinomycetota bacterium]